MGGKLSFIGAGPGSPDLLTVRGSAVLTAAQTVFAIPPYQETFADFLTDKTILIPFDFYFDEMVARIENDLLVGDVVFLIPGDLTFYSPFQPLIDHFANRCDVIAGVGVANAFSALLGKTFDLPGVCSQTVIASPRTLGDDGLRLTDLVGPGITLLLYMNNMPLSELVAELLKGYGSDVPIRIGHRISLPGEEIFCGDLSTIEQVVGGKDIFNIESDDNRPALTLVVVGETLSAASDGEWWDFRRRTIWQFREM